MRVDHRFDIGPHPVNRGMHRDFAGALGAAGNLIALHVDDDEIVALHHPLAHARRRGQNALGVQTDRDVAVVGRNPAFLKDQAADLADVLAVFALRFHHAGSFDCSRPHRASREEL